MKLWQALDKAIKGLKVTFNGVKRKYEITIEDDPFIIIRKLEDSKYNEGKLYIDVRDWEKVKNSVDELLNKEI